MRQLVFSSILCLAACAHASGNRGAASAPSAPLTAEQARAFDDGIDFVGSVQGLEGRWREDWDRDLQTRVGAASLVALITVRSLLTDTSPEQQITYHLVAQVDRELVGKARGDLELSVREDELGFSSVHENLGRITDRQFLAYVKNTPDGASWHLSPASPEVVSETESVISRLDRGMKQNADQQVIVRTN